MRSLLLDILLIKTKRIIIIINNVNKIRILIILIKTNIIPFLITVYNAERSGAYIINDLLYSY